MPFVPVPKDLSKVKTKVALNLTKRQLVCFAAAAAIGVPAYLATRDTVGSSAAVFIMMALMLPLFFIAMFEKDGQPAEKILRNMIRSMWYFPTRRVYRTDNLYQYLETEGKAIDDENETADGAGKTPAASHPAGRKRQGGI